MSMISRAISRSSLSVGIRPAPKSGLESMRRGSLRLHLHRREAFRRGVRN
jgi:hypothetical protein